MILKIWIKYTDIDHYFGSRKDFLKIILKLIFVAEGDIILQESPLVMGPKQNSRPLCLGCYKDVDGRFVCPRCGWPMCGPDCCSKAQHAAECQITPTGAKDKIKVISMDHFNLILNFIKILKINNITLNLISRCDCDEFEWIPTRWIHITIINFFEDVNDRWNHRKRCSLCTTAWWCCAACTWKRRNRPSGSSSWNCNRTASSASKAASKISTETLLSGTRSIQQPNWIDSLIDSLIVGRFIRETLELEPSDDLMMELCGIIFVNSFEMPFNKQAVFATASLFQHDCVANATRSFTSKGDIVIRAAVPIPRGENISLNYIDPLWGRKHNCSCTVQTSSNIEWYLNKCHVYSITCVHKSWYSTISGCWVHQINQI